MVAENVWLEVAGEAAAGAAAGAATGASVSGSVIFVSCEVLMTEGVLKIELPSGDIDLRADVCDAGTGRSCTRRKQLLVARFLKGTKTGTTYLVSILHGQLWPADMAQDLRVRA